MNSPVEQPKTADYLQALGLQREPFLDRIDDTFFYADPALVQRLDLLQHLTRFGDMLLAVVGPGGGGKSMLARQFLSRGDTGWRRCAIQGAQIRQETDFLTKLAECFDQNASLPPQQLKADMVRHLDVLRRGGHKAVVVVDDAHLLPDPVFQVLIELAGGARETFKLIRVLLLGEDTLDQKLSQAGLRSGQSQLMHRLELPRFTEEQTAAYLMYRLAVAGYSGDSPFSLTEIRALHKAAEGLPGKLNTLAHETLIERAGRIAVRDKSRPITEAARQPRKRQLTLLAGILGLGALLLLAVGGLYLAATGDQGNPSQAGTPWKSPLERVAEVPAPPEARLPGEASDTASISDSGKYLEKALNNKKAADTAVELSKTSTENGESRVETDRAIPADTAPAPATQVAPPDSQEAPAAEHPAAGGPDVAVADAEVTADLPSASAPAEPQTPPPGLEAEASTGDQASSAAAAPPEPGDTKVARPEPAASPSTPTPSRDEAPAPPAAPATTAHASTPEREAWLAARPGDRFTLQLLGVRSEKALERYLAQHRLPSPVAYYRTTYQGGDWFVLVQGEYPTMAAARAAVARLPPAVRRAKPWPRPFHAIQADIGKVTND